MTEDRTRMLAETHAKLAAATADQEAQSALRTAAELMPTSTTRNFPLRIASIIIPTTDNDGRRLTAVHEYAEKALLTGFGGFTQVLVTGAWQDPATGTVYRDTSRRYEVAMEDHGRNYLWLEDFARTVGAMASQEAIAVTYPSGAFRVVPTCAE